MNYAFGSCEEPHDSSYADVTALYEVQRTVSNVLSTLPSANNSDKLATELQEIMKIHEQYVGHLLRTKQQAMDVGFQWMEKELPGFRVYLFSGEYTCLFVEFSGPFKVVQLATNVFDMKNTLYTKGEK